MQIHPVNNNSFRGIKLSSNNYYKTRDIAQKLNEHDFYCLGHRTFYCSNILQDKIDLMKKIRKKAYFFKNGFGAIFLPWSKEVYLISEPINEQKMYSIVKELDKDAVINFAM